MCVYVCVCVCMCVWQASALSTGTSVHAFCVARHELPRVPSRTVQSPLLDPDAPFVCVLNHYICLYMAYIYRERERERERGPFWMPSTPIHRMCSLTIECVLLLQNEAPPGCLLHLLQVYAVYALYPLVCVPYMPYIP